MPTFESNWAQPFLDTMRTRRTSVQENDRYNEEQRIAELTRALQRKQVEAQMERQRKEDEANEAYAASRDQQEAPSMLRAAAPVQAPQPLVVAPDVYNGGPTPGFVVDPKIGQRPGGYAKIPDAFKAEAAKRMPKTLDDYVRQVQSSYPPVTGSELRSPWAREAALKREVLRNAAPLEALKLWQDAEEKRLDQENARAGTRNTAAHYKNTEAQQTREYNRQVASDEYNRSWEKTGKGIVADVVPDALKRVGEVARDWFGRAPIEAAKIAGRESTARIGADQRAKAAENRIKLGEDALKQKEDQFTRGLQAVAAENDTKRRQEMSIKVFELQGQLERDREELNKMRESYTYKREADPGAALAGEGGPVVQRPGLLWESDQPTAPRGVLPPIPHPASVLQQQAKAAVATMTPQQKQAEKARLRALKGQ